MEGNPNLNQSLYARELRDQLGSIRNEIAEEAFKTRGDVDLHRAIRLQGKYTLDMLKIVTSLWTDTYVHLLRQNKVEPSLAENEIAYSRALAQAFESHLERLWTMFGGRAGETEIRATKSATEAEIEVTAARRQHAAFSGFCAVYISILRDRAEELESEAAASLKL